MQQEGLVLVAARELAEALHRPGRDDLLVTFEDVRTSPDAPARLQAAARSDTTIASASAMLAGTPYAPESAGDDLSVEDAAVAQRSPGMRPRIAGPVAGCVLLRRSALDVVDGVVEADPADAAGWLLEFAEHASARALVHVLADDVLAQGPLAEPEVAYPDERLPHRTAARPLDEAEEAPARRAIVAAGRALGGLTVTIDARALGPRRTGTEIHALELIVALGRRSDLRLRVVTPPDLDPFARTAMETIDGLELLPYEEAAKAPQPVDHVVHRPSQVFTPDDLLLLAPLGHRLVVTHQDLISYRASGYHQTPDGWLAYRRTTRDALASADHVVFFTEHARADAMAEGLIEPERSSIVLLGTDHRVRVPAAAAVRPPGLEGDQPFLLHLGTDLPHKQRAFSARLLSALRDELGWDGRLVVAGPGTQVSGEAHVIGLGPVTEAEKTWLLAHAAAVAYPTLYEGFGLVPFEAANAGTPCVFAAQTALAEILPTETALLEPWDASISAARVRPLLEPGGERDAHVQALRSGAARLRWDETAARLVEVYETVLVRPVGELRRGPRERLLLEGRLAEAEEQRLQEWRRFEAYRAQIGSDALGLVGPDGLLGPGDQRALMAILAQPRLRRPVLAAARGLYGLASRVLGR